MRRYYICKELKNNFHKIRQTIFDERNQKLVFQKTFVERLLRNCFYHELINF